MAQNSQDSRQDLPQLVDYPHLPEAIIETIQLPLLVLDEAFVVVRTNNAFCSHFRVSLEGTVGQPLEDLGNGQWKIAELRHMLEETIPRHGHIEDYRIEHEFPSLGRRAILLNARRINGNPERPDLYPLQRWMSRIKSVRFTSWRGSANTRKSSSIRSGKRSLCWIGISG